MEGMLEWASDSISIFYNNGYANFISEIRSVSMGSTAAHNRLPDQQLFTKKKQAIGAGWNLSCKYMSTN